MVLLNRFTLKNKLCIAFVLVMFNHKTCGHKGKGAGLGSGKDLGIQEKKRETQEITQEQKLGRAEVEDGLSSPRDQGLGWLCPLCVRWPAY